MNRDLQPDETLDDLLHGELKLIQNKDGYRYSVDALLLSSFALPFVGGADVLDMGTGAGVVALILAQRGRPRSVVGVELQKPLAALAKRNAALNPTTPRVEVIRGDACLLRLECGPGSFGVIVSNPPFHRSDSGMISPNMEKAFARHELAMSLKRWLHEAKKLLAPAGHLMIVFPADQQDRLAAAAAVGLGLARRQYALDRPGGSKKLILVDLGMDPGPTEDLPDVPIETEQGRFSLDGYR